MSKLVAAVGIQSQLDRDTYTLDCHDGHGPDGAADGQVDERILASVARSNAVDHDSGKDNDQQAINEKTWLDGVIQNLVNRVDFLVRRRVQHNDDCANQAHCATEFAQSA